MFAHSFPFMMWQDKRNQILESLNCFTGDLNRFSKDFKRHVMIVKLCEWKCEANAVGNVRRCTAARLHPHFFFCFADSGPLATYNNDIRTGL